MIHVLRRMSARHPVWAFLSVTYGFSWICWSLSLLRHESRSPTPLVMIGGLGPPLAALLLSRTGERTPGRSGHNVALIIAGVIAAAITFLQVTTGGRWTLEGRPPLVRGGIDLIDVILLGVFARLVSVVFAAGRSRDAGQRARFASLLQWRAPIWAWLVVLLAYPSICAGGVLLTRLFGGPSSVLPITGRPLMQWLPLVVVGLLFTLITGGLEEPGWRGFMLTELQKRFCPLVAALLVAAAWSLWHVPLHFSGLYGGDVVNAMSIRILATVPLSILMTWLFNRCGANLLVLAVFHTVVNNISVFVPGTAWSLALGVLVACALIVSDRMWRPVQAA